VERAAQLHGNLNISPHDVTWSAVFLTSTDSKQNHTSTSYWNVIWKEQTHNQKQ